MKNIIDLLLNVDAEQIERPSKQIEIKRLSNILGEPFVVTCKALSFDKYSEIQDKCLNLGSGKNVKYDVQESQIMLCLNGVFDAEDKQLFTNKLLKEKFNVINSKELCKKLLLSGEISQLGDEITKLTGFGDNTVEEIKGL